jgi:hypothetical protein
MAISASEGSLTPTTRTVPKYINNVFSANVTVDNTIYFKQTVGEDLPDFQKRRRAGELLPHTNFSQFEVSGATSGDWNARAASTGYYTVVTGFGPTSSYGSAWRPSQTIPSDLVPDTEYFVQAAAASIAEGNFDALTFIAELGSTKRMVRQALSRMASFSRNATLRSIKDVPGLWLEARYGWRPLMHDMLDIVDALNNLNDKRTRFSERAGTTYNTSSFEENILADNSGYTRKETITTYNTIRCGGSVTADMLYNNNIQIDPIATAWELIPYSFVVDWFINVAQYIQAQKFATFSTESVASGGYRIDQIRTVKTEDIFKSGYAWSGTFYVSGTTASTWTKRVPTSVSIDPLFHVKLDELKILDLVSLIYQRLR